MCNSRLGDDFLRNLVATLAVSVLISFNFLHGVNFGSSVLISVPPHRKYKEIILNEFSLLYESPQERQLGEL